MPRLDDRGTRFSGVQGDNVCAVDVREEVVLRSAAGCIVVVNMIVLMRAGAVVMVMIVRHTVYADERGFQLLVDDTVLLRHGRREQKTRKLRTRAVAGEGDVLIALAWQNAR